MKYKVKITDLAIPLDYKSFCVRLLDGWLVFGVRTPQSNLQLVALLKPHPNSFYLDDDLKIRFVPQIYQLNLSQTTICPQIFLHLINGWDVGGKVDGSLVYGVIEKDDIPLFEMRDVDGEAWGLAIKPQKE